MTRRLLRTLLLALPLSAGLVLPAFTQQTVVIPTRVIYPGETVTADSLEDVPLRRQLKNVAAVAVDRHQLEGKIARRTLLPGRMIPVTSVREAHLVTAGSPVQVLFVHGALEISVAGVPLQHGAAGDLIKVRNLDTGAVFSGVVMIDGTIRVSAT